MLRAVPSRWRAFDSLVYGFPILNRTSSSKAIEEDVFETAMTALDELPDETPPPPRAFSPDSTSSKKQEAFSYAIQQKKSLLRAWGLTTEEREFVMQGEYFGSAPVHEIDQRCKWYKKQFKYSKEEMRELLVKDRDVLSYSMMKDVVPKLKKLPEVGFTKSEIRIMVLRRPEVLKYSIMDNIVPTIETYKRLGLKRQDVWKLLKKEPMLFSMPYRTEIRPKLEWLTHRVGIDEHTTMQALLVKNSDVIGPTSLDNMKKVYTWLKEQGYVNHECISMITLNPRILASDVEDMSQKMAFLIEYLKKGPTSVVRFPLFFSYPFEDWILLRTAYVHHKGVNYTMFPLKEFFRETEDKMMNYCGIGSDHELATFKVWWHKLDLNEKLLAVRTGLYMDEWDIDEAMRIDAQIWTELAEQERLQKEAEAQKSKIKL